MYAKLFQILASCIAETPKKVVGNNCFLCSSPLIPSGRVRVVGKSSVCISRLIEETVKIRIFYLKDIFRTSYKTNMRYFHNGLPIAVSSLSMT